MLNLDRRSARQLAEVEFKDRIDHTSTMELCWKNRSLKLTEEATVFPELFQRFRVGPAGWFDKHEPYHRPLPYAISTAPFSLPVLLKKKTNSRWVFRCQSFFSRSHKRQELVVGHTTKTRVASCAANPSALPCCDPSP